ncbi:hypothetical protein WMQ67_03620 [Vibrio harveyi]|uniref:hypothetical protein n=1 Tax=Vibrio harveyi TaxID=669 RepID=UPI0037506EE6
MAIIIDELGINPWSLYHADVQAKGTNSSYVKLESDGTAVLKVTKWRQRRIQRKSTVPRSLTHPSELTDEKINASFCTQFALLARSQHAEQLKSNRLWLYETKTQLAELSGDGSHLFKSFREECLTEIEGIEAPTLMKIRSSRAIEKYLSTGGDVTAVAGYLGNKVKTALDTYIPLFLQEAIYRNKIHNFQNLYFVLATSSLEERLDVLKLTAQDYDNQVKRLINNEDFGGELFEVLCPPHKPLEQTFYFICSPENFAFALRYVSKNTYSEEDDNEMYLICKQALEKAGRAGVAIQRMLIQAQQLKVENR